MHFSRNHPLAALLALFCVGLLAYSNSLYNDFLIDDYDIILGNPNAKNPQLILAEFIPKATPGGAENQFSKPHYYRPLAHITPLALYQMFGADVTGYHVANLIFFIFAAFSVYALLNTLFKNWALSFLTSLLFAVHPLNAVLVNYKNLGAVLSLELIALAWASIFFILGKRQAMPANFHILSALLFITANLYHDTAITLPLYFLLFTYLEDKKMNPSNFLKIAPFLIIAALFLLLRFSLTSSLGGIIAKTQLFQLNFLEYLATYTKIIFWYMAKFFAVEGIVLIWASPVVQSRHWLYVSAFLPALGILWKIFTLRKKHTAIFAFTLWPVIGFGALLWGSLYGLEYGFLIEPHWLIFPSVGVFALLALSLLNLKKFLDKRVVYLIIGGVLFIFITSTRHYNLIWRNEKTYCEYWLKHVPGFIPAKNFLASSYLREGNTAKAKELLLEIVYADPDHALAYYKLGWISYLKGDLREAVKNYEQALLLSPNSAIVKRNLEKVEELLKKSK